MPSGLILYYFDGNMCDYFYPPVGVSKLNVLMLSAPYKIIYDIFPYAGTARFKNIFTRIEYKDFKLAKEDYSEFYIYNSLNEVILSFIVKNCYAKKVKNFNINKIYKRNIYIPTESVTYHEYRVMHEFKLNSATIGVFDKIIYKDFK